MRALYLLVLGAGVAGFGCATSAKATCDPSTPGCVADAAPVTPPDAAVDAKPDAPPLLGFGSTCTDSTQCASDICILTPTGGVCSQTCGSCPDGYGCFGVLGAIDPNQVSYVCVPTTTQLCSPCVQDTECTQIGMDKCVTEATGRKYCARDCSTVTCPTGYDCAAEDIGGTTYHECVPHSGACDCQTAAQAGAMDPCSITTALGTTCAGSSTCGGTAGWGACAPPSATDDPDATYTDNNCDGIDGDLTKGIFVAGGGTNSGTCGLTFSTPCQTISYGIVRAVQASRPNVYVQAGTYNEVIVLISGVNVWGGYDFNWQRGPYTNPANKVTVVGKQDTTAGGDGEYLTVRAHDLIVPVTIADLILQAPDASGTGGTLGRDGKSSYVVHAKGASVNLARVQLVAGKGAGGAIGTAGADAQIVDAQTGMFGAAGGDGVQKTVVCDSSSRGGGGGGGTNSCASSPSSRAMNGGGGGQGGTMDTDCGVFSSDFNARGGDNGADAAAVFGAFGLHGNGGSGGSTCGATSNGNPGLVVNGAGGGIAGSLGYLGGGNSAYWYAYGGNAGGTGENGSGGGGGGGGGGCDNGTDAWGGGGSGGGAGGCAARSGGGGGGGGGGSFGVFATGSSTIALDTCQLFRAAAGAGGAGGTGGRGQSGGGSLGPASHPNSATPGLGGNGGHGGHGGGGGGGQGGRAVGILSTSDSTITGTCSQTQGTAGTGGTGGASAPFAPAAERDGNAGTTGTAGTVEDTRVCATSTSC